MMQRLLAIAAIVLALPAHAQSTGGVTPGTMTPPIPGNVPPAKAAITGSSAVGESSRDPGLAAANRASSAQATPPEPPALDQTPPRAAQPNKNYAGSTVAPNSGR